MVDNRTFLIYPKNTNEYMLGEAPAKIYAAAQKNREIPMGQQE